MRITRLALVVCLLPAALVRAVPAEGATLRVCKSGCAYSNLQAAIDAALPGDTILLRAGETFVGPFVLRAKSASSVAWITIRSDAADSVLPADGVRLVPSGKPGANTDRSLLARLVGQSGTLKTTPVIRTDAGAHHYVLKFLEIDGAANLGYETLIQLGTDTTATPPHHLVFDRVYAHGDFSKGQKRGIALDGASIDILNSYVTDFKAVNADAQGIAGFNGPGPFRIVNNYVEAAGENILFGGSDPAVTNLVPSDIEIRRNHFYKPLAWRQDILARPGSPRASASGSGALSAGTHYFKVVALMNTDTRVAVSLPSTEVSATVGASGAVTVSWSGISGANRYRIYRGTSPGGQSRYLETGSSGTSFSYTGKSELSGTPPTSGTRWTVKNILELKNAERVMVEGNIFENIWQSGQYGYALVLTPRNQYGGAPWVRVRDITFLNNIVRHASGVLQVSGYDATNTSQQTRRITLRNNLFYDIDPAKYGGGAKCFLVGEGVADVRIDHNTIVHTNSSVVYAYGTLTMSGFVYTSNLSRHHTYGIMAEGGRPGQYSIDKYFPSAIVRYNVLAGGPASSYPATNVFPTDSQFTSSFANFAGGDYRLLTSSPFYSAGEGGSVPGANIGAIEAALAGSATPPPQPPPAEPPPPTTNQLPVPRTGGPYVAAPGTTVTVDGSSSSDEDGTIVDYTWRWSDEVRVNAADVAPADIKGTRWARVQDAGAAAGVALHNPNRGDAKIGSALAAPGSYVEARFHAAAGVPYRLWFRMRAEGDHYANDSMYVQFSNAVNASGQALARIGSSSGLAVVLEEGSSAGVAGWGWNDAGYGSLGAPIYFAASGVQTVRIQQREDGIRWDQMILSTGAYFQTRPGDTRVDDTIVSGTFGTSTGAVASHKYVAGGLYPLVLTVRDNNGGVASAATTVTVSGAASSVTARAGGPYSGSVGSAVTMDANASTVPSGPVTYTWTFGDDIVIRAADLASSAVHGNWRLVADGSAAGGVALESINGAAKLSSPLAAPADYVDVTFRAAAGVPYRVWLRMRAASDSYANDSVYVQFSGTVTSGGAAAYRTGTSSALAIVLEEGAGAGVQGWGWADAGYGGLSAPVYFNTSGLHTMRIQRREDGLKIDQIVISAGRFYDDAPGATLSDTTFVPQAGATGAVVSHTFRWPGVYPVQLTIDAVGERTGDATTATIK